MSPTDLSNALVVSSGYQASHVLPVIDGRLDARNCKRINLGGAQSTWYMQRLVQLKHPNHAAQITLKGAQVSAQVDSGVRMGRAQGTWGWQPPSFA